MERETDRQRDIEKVQKTERKRERERERERERNMNCISLLQHC